MHDIFFHSLNHLKFLINHFGLKLFISNNISISLLVSFITLDLQEKLCMHSHFKFCVNFLHYLVKFDGC